MSTHSEIVRQADAARAVLDSNRFRALLRTYEQADSIIAAKNIRTVMANDKTDQTPAWTSNKDGATITFNAPALGQLETREDYVRVTGVNYHELCHAMDTPMRSPKYAAIYTRVDSEQYGKEFAIAFNALEDQRIESMMAVRAPSVVPYFQSMISNYILSKSDDFEDIVYLMLYGRKYMGHKVIAAAKQQWGHSDADRDEAEQIIDSYRVLDLMQKQNIVVAVGLVNQFMELLRRLKPPAPPSFQHSTDFGAANDSDARDCNGSERASKGVQAGKDKPKSERPQGKGQAGQGKPQGEGDEEGQGGGGQGQESDQNGSESGSGGQGQGDLGDMLDAYAMGAGDETGDHSQWGTDLDGLLKALMESAIESWQVETDYASYRATFRAGRLGQAEMKRHERFSAAIESEATILVKRIAVEFSKLLEMADPGWKYRQSTGKLNIQRYAMGERDIENLFDEWEEGNSDATSIEGVALLDISGSMSGHTDMLSGAAWVIKRACDLIGVPFTVIAYDTVGFIIYDRDQRADVSRFPSIKAIGGTDPTSVLAEAYAILSASPKRKRYLLTMTDGVWNDGRPDRKWSYGAASINAVHNDFVANIGALPRTVTQMVYFDPGGYYERNPDAMQAIAWHNHQIHTVISNLAQLPLVFRTAMRRLLTMRG